MRTSDRLDELATALAKAQAEMQPVVKDKKANLGGKYSYAYADLASVIEAATQTLGPHGLSIAMPFEIDDRGEQIAVMALIHTSGQQIVSRYPIRPASDNPQAVGSAVSYARRYMLMSLINLPTADDDGQAAMPRSDDRQASPARRQAPQWDPQAVPEGLRGPRSVPARGRGRPSKAQAEAYNRAREDYDSNTSMAGIGPEPTSELFQDVMEAVREASSMADLKAAWEKAADLTNQQEHADMQAAWRHRRDALKGAANRSDAARDSIKASLTLPKPA